MTNLLRLAVLLGFAAMAACSEAPSTPVSTTPTLAEQGCLRDVSATTNNGDVTILTSEFSEAGTEMTIGVGPDRAPWRCIGYGDGTTAGIMSLVDEGAL